LSGHKLVEFSSKERDIFHRYVQNGGFVFVDDCNHDIDGLFAKSFEQEMAKTFGQKGFKRFLILTKFIDVSSNLKIRPQLVSN
jgi:hypothetical protein